MSWWPIPYHYLCRSLCAPVCLRRCADEIDAIGTKRYDAHSGGEREIQRTMLELLNQLDGFDAMGDVKVIMATNRIETLDPALIRPGEHGARTSLVTVWCGVLWCAMGCVAYWHA